MERYVIMGYKLKGNETVAVWDLSKVSVADAEAFSQEYKANALEFKEVDLNASNE